MSKTQHSLKNEKNPFTQIPNELICDPELSCKAKAIYCYLHSRPDNWVFFMNDIANVMALGHESLRDGMTQLETKGWIMRERLKTAGKFSGQDIHVYIKPRFNASLLQNHDGKKPVQEKPLMENQAHNNTNSTNTDNKKNKQKKSDLMLLADWEAKNGNLELSMFAKFITENQLDTEKVRKELEYFRDKAREKNYLKADFEATFRNWLRNARYGRGLEFYRRGDLPRTPPPQPTGFNFSSREATGNNL